MGSVISGVAGGVSSILGGIGATKAANQQQQYQDKAMNQQKEGYATATGWLSPYEKAGQTGLAGLQAIAGKPIDRNALLTNYFKSPEYLQQADQARYQSLSAAEATGGLGSTATSNQLASIAPTLGQNYLSDMTNQQQNMYAQLLGLSGMGAESANSLSNLAMNQGSTMAGMYQQKGQIMAGKAAIPWQTAASANYSVGKGFGDMFSLGGNTGSGYYGQQNSGSNF